MVLDALANAPLYAGLSPHFAAAFAFLARPDLDALPLGRTDIDGDAVFALVQSYTTRDPLPRRFETHRRYADVQFVAAGVERIAVADPAALHLTEAYDPARDAAFFTGEGVELALPSNHFMVLFPHEAHQPCLHPASGPATVRKIVLKVRVA